MKARADLPEVRNPVLALPAFQAILGLDAGVRAALAALLYDLAAQAREKSASELRRNKPWMFVYWRCIGTYARHIARALNRFGHNRNSEAA